MDELTLLLPTIQFPMKMFYILNMTSRSPDLSKILSWDDSGTTFAVHDVKKFQDIILSKYFRHCKMTSFQRQLNMYGFRRHSNLYIYGKVSHAYFHSSFLRDRPDLLHLIQRITCKKESSNSKTLNDDGKEFDPNEIVSKEENFSNYLRVPNNDQYALPIDNNLPKSSNTSTEERRMLSSVKIMDQLQPNNSSAHISHMINQQGLLNSNMMNQQGLLNSNMMNQQGLLNSNMMMHQQGLLNSNMMNQQGLLNSNMMNQQGLLNSNMMNQQGLLNSNMMIHQQGLSSSNIRSSGNYANSQIDNWLEKRRKLTESISSSTLFNSHETAPSLLWMSSSVNNVKSAASKLPKRKHDS